MNRTLNTQQHYLKRTQQGIKCTYQEMDGERFKCSKNRTLIDPESIQYLPPIDGQ